MSRTKEKYRRIVIEIINILRNKEGNWIASSLAYSFIVSFVPIIFATVIIAIRYFVEPENITVALNHYGIHIPYIDVVVNHVKNDLGGQSFFLIYLLVGYSIYMGSRSVRSIIHANNHFFDLEPRSALYNWGISFLVIIVLLASVFGIITLIGFLPTILTFLNADIMLLLVQVMILPTFAIVLFMIFQLTSGLRLKGSSLWRGSIISALGIVIIVVFSALLIGRGSTVNQIFGPLITLLLVAHYLYFISLCIYYGMVVNVATYRVEHIMRQEDVMRKVAIYR